MLVGAIGELLWRGGVRFVVLDFRVGVAFLGGALTGVMAAVDGLTGEI